MAIKRTRSFYIQFFLMQKSTAALTFKAKFGIHCSDWIFCSSVEKKKILQRRNNLSWIGPEKIAVPGINGTSFSLQSFARYQRSDEQADRQTDGLALTWTLWIKTDLSNLCLKWNFKPYYSFSTNLKKLSKRSFEFFPRRLFLDPGEECRGFAGILKSASLQNFPSIYVTDMYLRNYFLWLSVELGPTEWIVLNRIYIFCKNYNLLSYNN